MGTILMTLSQLEQRLSALEKRFECLEQRLPNGNGMAPNVGDEESQPTDHPLIPGVEYPLVPSVPRPENVVKARIVSIEQRSRGLGLSDAEWASLHLGDDNA